MRETFVQVYRCILYTHYTHFKMTGEKNEFFHRKSKITYKLNLMVTDCGLLPMLEEAMRKRPAPDCRFKRAEKKAILNE